MTAVYVIHARLRSADGFTGLAHNACDRCGRQMFGTRQGRRWRHLMGHPWHHDQAAWWCTTCLNAGHYNVIVACTHDDVDPP